MKGAFPPFLFSENHAAHRLRTMMIRSGAAAVVALAIGFLSLSDPAIGQQGASTSTQNASEWVRDAVTLEEHAGRMREMLQRVEPYYNYRVGGVVPPRHGERGVIDRGSNEALRTEAAGPARLEETAAHETSAGLRPEGATTGIRIADMSYGLGLKRLVQGDIAEAIDHLQIAVRGRPDNADYRTALAGAYLASGFDDAVYLAADQYGEAVKLNPDLTSAREGLAESSWLIGDEATALDNMEILFADENGVREQYATRLAEFYLLSGKTERGLRMFAKALPQVENKNGFKLLMATLEMRQSDKRAAQALVMDVLASAPSDSAEAKLAKEMLEQGVGE